MKRQTILAGASIMAVAALLSRLQDGLYWDLYAPERPWRNSYAPAASSFLAI